LDVRLATRPNGSTAWVRRGDVALTATPFRITVDLATRRVTLFRLGQEIMNAPAGVGTSQDPTPTGQYFVAFFEASPAPGYGPFIIVTSAHSTTIANWEGAGDAVVGIHGPLGADSLIGTTGVYLSHGCIRLPVPDLAQLRDVPAGSPISITG
jgi:lipoprotein-anchoring transpeptidase ErfK/SrfK